MESLIALGFTRLEATICVHLLEHSPATGYQIAKAIEKPNSNTYQALEALTSRGLLLVEDGSPRRYRAMPYQEMLRQLDATHRTRVEAAARELASIRPARGDLHVYRVTERAQVFERCFAMLRSARHKVLVDAFPGAFAVISEEVGCAAARGVEVLAKTYEPIELEGVVTVRDYRGDQVPELWGVQWLNLTTDGRQHLYACLDGECQQVIQAIWTESPWVAFLAHVGLYSEMVVDEILRSLRDSAEEARVLDVVRRLGYGSDDDLPGRLDLMRWNSRRIGEEK